MAIAELVQEGKDDSKAFAQATERMKFLLIELDIITRDGLLLAFHFKG